ncbi:hypothetical protein M9H77_07514 [Catharanthus roseus]|uniref:Uncharacterized protein n=1 Tax=Catharanthus roseus TaxID=4058 RepID=A0ACC0BV60_CATRO|nr:hypothetical protein M9H77_07514 [Catharanthus roseus]
MNIPQEKRVKLVACRLKGGASAWWGRRLHRRQREDYEQILFQQYQRYQQNQRSIQEYTADFMRLVERNDLRESEVHQIRDKIGVYVVKSMTEAKNLATKAELMIRDRGGSRIEGNKRTYDNDNFQKSSGEETSRSFTYRNKAAQGWN